MKRLETERLQQAEELKKKELLEKEKREGVQQASPDSLAIPTP
jgi:hypothetical protein